MLPEQLLLTAIFIPLITAALMPMLHRLPAWRDAASILGGVLLLANNLALYGHFQQGTLPVIRLLTPIAGMDIAVMLDPLGMLFMLVASSLWLPTTIYAMGYLRHNKEPAHTRFFTCFAVAIACAMGIALSENLFTAFLFYELMTIATYPLVTHAGTDEARQKGRRYLATLMAASLILFLPAMGITSQLTGHLSFRMGGILGEYHTAPWFGLLLAAFVFGVAKAAMMPLHGWLPAAMVAPAPVSALLHAVAVVKAGVFLIARLVVDVFGVDNLAAYAKLYPWCYGWLEVAAGLSALVASIMALRQDNLKLRLAYSTVAQLAYITLALSILKPYAVVGGTLHIAAHAVGKITLFFVAGSIYTAAHRSHISQLNGIGRRMPWTMGAFTLASLSMIGLPPTVGFISKWYMLKGMLMAEAWFALAMMAATTLLSAAYLLPIIYRAFFIAPTGKPHGEAPATLVVSLSITALMTLLLFLFPEPIIRMEAILFAPETRWY